jgi:hypothetical protein
VTVVDPQKVWTLHLKGEGMNATLLDDPHPASQSAHSFIRIEESNGSYYIRELSAGPIAKSFRFRPAKGPKRPIEARTFTLPVSSGGGF